MIDPKRIAFLSDCASLSNDEWGERVSSLLWTMMNVGYMSDEFKAALEKEIEAELIWAEGACTIVECTETREVTYKELVVDE